MIPFWLKPLHPSPIIHSFSYEFADEAQLLSAVQQCHSFSLWKVFFPDFPYENSVEEKI